MSATSYEITHVAAWTHNPDERYSDGAIRTLGDVHHHLMASGHLLLAAAVAEIGADYAALARYERHGQDAAAYMRTQANEYAHQANVAFDTADVHGLDYAARSLAYLDALRVMPD
jgi:hypothetical protein